MILQKNTFYNINLKVQKTNYLKTKYQCKDDESFFEWFSSAIYLLANFDNCTRNCTAISLLPPIMQFYDIPLCETPEEFECAREITSDILESDYTVHLLEAWLKSCSNIQYLAEVLDISSLSYDDNDHTTIEFSYQFAYPRSVKVYEEYLIYDTIGMIGYIGGTLGMFLGFSFSNVIALAIKFFQNLNIEPRNICKLFKKQENSQINF